MVKMFYHSINTQYETIIKILYHKRTSITILVSSIRTTVLIQETL